MKTQKLNQRQARQALYLSRFNFTLKYILGIRMGKTNELSRWPDLKMETENNNKNQKLIKKEQIKGIMEVVIEEPETILVEKIKRAR